MSLASSKVLVLNRGWSAISVVTLEKALKKLTGTYRNGEPKAKIIDCLHDFRTMTWDDWAQLIPDPHYCPECHKIMDRDQIEAGKCKVCGSTVGEKGMRAVNAILRIPRVIQLTRFDKIPKQKIHYNRRTIYRRDNNTCQYCGGRPGTKELSIDHVIPRAQGGMTTWENVVVACTGCNSKKADRTPEQAGMRLLRQPRKPQYNLYVGDIRVRDWETWLGVSYWMVELENDIQE
jgi:5-methylcytosine-specific restriction endonuclease McrA